MCVLAGASCITNETIHAALETLEENCIEEEEGSKRGKMF